MFLSLQHFIYPCLSVMLCLSVCLFMFLPACAPDEGGRQEGQNLKLLLQAGNLVSMTVFCMGIFNLFGSRREFFFTSQNL